MRMQTGLKSTACTSENTVEKAFVWCLLTGNFTAIDYIIFRMEILSRYSRRQIV